MLCGGYREHLAMSWELGRKRFLEPLRLKGMRSIERKAEQIVIELNPYGFREWQRQFRPRIETLTVLELYSGPHAGTLKEP